MKNLTLTNTTTPKFIIIALTLIAFNFIGCADAEDQASEESESSTLEFIDSGKMDTDQSKNLADQLSGTYEGSLHTADGEIKKTNIEIRQVSQNQVKIYNDQSENHSEITLTLYQNDHAVLAKNAASEKVRFIFDIRNQTVHYYSLASGESFVME